MCVHASTKVTGCPELSKSWLKRHVERQTDTTERFTRSVEVSALVVCTTLTEVICRPQIDFTTDPPTHTYTDP